ncbi:hypothetical protein MMPV_008920 [Pyropia vietnamensis]
MPSPPRSPRRGISLVPPWVGYWLLFSAVISLQEAAFLYLRPASLPGGDLARFFPHYAAYIQMDGLFRDMSDRTLRLLSAASLVEVPLQLLVAAYAVPASAGLSAATLALTALAATVVKTGLFLAYDWPHMQPTAAGGWGRVVVVAAAAPWLVVPGVGIVAVHRRLRLVLGSKEYKSA